MSLAGLLGVMGMPARAVRDKLGLPDEGAAGVASEMLVDPLLWASLGGAGIAAAVARPELERMAMNRLLRKIGKPIPAEESLGAFSKVFQPVPEPWLGAKSGLGPVVRGGQTARFGIGTPESGRYAPGYVSKLQGAPSLSSPLGWKLRPRMARRLLREAEDKRMDVDPSFAALLKLASEGTPLEQLESRMASAPNRSYAVPMEGGMPFQDFVRDVVEKSGQKDIKSAQEAAIAEMDRTWPEAVGGAPPLGGRQDEYLQMVPPEGGTPRVGTKMPRPRQFPATHEANVDIPETLKRPDLGTPGPMPQVQESLVPFAGSYPAFKRPVPGSRRWAYPSGAAQAKIADENRPLATLPRQAEQLGRIVKAYENPRTSLEELEKRLTMNRPQSKLDLARNPDAVYQYAYSKPAVQALHDAWKTEMQAARGAAIPNASNIGRTFGAPPKPDPSQLAAILSETPSTDWYGETLPGFRGGKLMIPGGERYYPTIEKFRNHYLGLGAEPVPVGATPEWQHRMGYTPEGYTDKTLTAQERVPQWLIEPQNPNRIEEMIRRYKGPPIQTPKVPEGAFRGRRTGVDPASLAQQIERQAESEGQAISGLNLLKRHAEDVLEPEGIPVGGPGRGEATNIIGDAQRRAIAAEMRDNPMAGLMERAGRQADPAESVLARLLQNPEAFEAQQSQEQLLAQSLGVSPEVLLGERTPMELREQLAGIAPAEESEQVLDYFLEHEPTRLKRKTPQQAMRERRKPAKREAPIVAVNRYPNKREMGNRIIRAIRQASAPRAEIEMQRAGVKPTKTPFPIHPIEAAKRRVSSLNRQKEARRYALSMRWLQSEMDKRKIDYLMSPKHAKEFAGAKGTIHMSPINLNKVYSPFSEVRADPSRLVAAILLGAAPPSAILATRRARRKRKK